MIASSNTALKVCLFDFNLKQVRCRKSEGAMTALAGHQQSARNESWQADGEGQVRGTVNTQSNYKK